MIGDRWGVTGAEVALTFPCDEMIPRPALALWRGVTVLATPEQVWPWIGQIRLAPYSYDWIDNLGRRSPPELINLAPPEPGEPFTRAFGGRPAGRIVSTENGVALTGAVMGALMSYVLVPVDAATTRLLLKVVVKGGRMIAPFVSVGDLIMARRQLLNLKKLAEKTARREAEATDLEAG